jgi:hypothetical protein
MMEGGGRRGEVHDKKKGREENIKRRGKGARNKFNR